MNKKFYHLSILMLCAFILPVILLAQIQTNSWQDGDPAFTKSYPVMSNISFDPFNRFVTLQFVDSLSVEPSVSRFILDGVNWRWPLDPLVPETSILSAEDIELFVYANTALYAVADGTGQKVVVWNVEKNEHNITFKKDSGPLHLERPVDVEIFNENSQLKFLITDQGRHRVIKLDYITQGVSNVYGLDDQIGIGNGRLNSPADAVKIPNQASRYLICDQGNKRVILIDEVSKSILWEWGRQGVGTLNLPEDVEYLAGRNQVLITDIGDNRVIIVDMTSNAVVWQYASGLSAPTDADTLANGNILIADAGNKRIIEVTRAGTPTIVWEYSQGIDGLKDVDRLERRTDFPEFNNETLVLMKDTESSFVIPFRVGFNSDTLTSKPRYLKHAADFDELRFSAITTPGITRTKFKLRSGKSEDGVQQAQWYGPINSSDFYSVSGTAINPIHDGDSWYQVQIHLETSNKLYTPEVRNLGVKFHFYKNNEDGILRSDLIGEAPGNVITRWKELKIKSRLPDNPAASLDQLGMRVNLLNAKGDTLWWSFPNLREVESSFDLSNSLQLKDLQVTRIEIVFKSSSSAFSPILDNINLSWEYKKAEPSKLMYIDQANDSVASYRARRSSTDLTADPVILKLFDTNIVSLRDKVIVPVVALQSGDRVDVELTYDTFLNFYKSPPISAIVITDLAQLDMTDLSFQVFDRDILLAQYIDPTDPSDAATAQVLMLKNVKGELRVENSNGVAFIDRVRIGDVLFAHVLGETDHNISDAQDSIRIQFTNTSNGDFEELWAKEIANPQSGTFNTGEFITAGGMNIVSGLTAEDSNGVIEAVRGHKLTVLFDNNDDLIKNLEIPADTVFVLSGIFDAQIGPNPYYESRHNRLGLRVASSSGEITLEKLQVINFAGQRIVEIDANNLAFDAAPPFPAGQYAACDNWWNLQNVDGTPVSSGTYFVKISGSVKDIATRTDRKVDKIVKFVIVR